MQKVTYVLIVIDNQNVGVFFQFAVSVIAYGSEIVALELRR